MHIRSALAALALVACFPPFAPQAPTKVPRCLVVQNDGTTGTEVADMEAAALGWDRVCGRPVFLHNCTGPNPIIVTMHDGDDPIPGECGHSVISGSSADVWNACGAVYDVSRHELGHLLGLLHTEGGLMNPNVIVGAPWPSSSTLRWAGWDCH